MVTEFLTKELKGRNHSEVLGIDGRTTLEWMLGTYGGKLWTGSIWLRIWTSVRVL
jgi:hypothetical protein